MKRSREVLLRAVCGVFVLMLCSILSGCGFERDSVPDADGSLCIRRTVDRVSSIDPVFAEAVGASRCVGLVYETLLQYDYYARPYKLVPFAAESMPSVEDSGRTIIFRLRDDVFFGPDKCFADSNGRPGTRRMVSSDVEYSLKRLADAKLSSPGWWTIEGKICGMDEFHRKSVSDAPTDYDTAVEGIETPDDSTVIIRLTEPSPQIMWVFAMPYTAIVPREAVELYGDDFSQREAGSGPFMLKSWKRDYEMVFVRRTGRDPARDHVLSSPDGCPPDEIRYFVMDDASTRWMAFLSGMLDVNGEISRDNWDAVMGPDGKLSKELEGKGIRLVSHDSLSTFYIGFNMDDPVVGGDSGRELRRAVSCAFNSAEWVSLNRGRVSQAFGAVPPGVERRLTGYSPFGYNLKRAKELLAGAGFPEGVDKRTGRRLELSLDLGRTDQETRESAELFASFMERIGISVSLSYNNWPLFLKKVGRRESQMFFVGWIADFPDAMNFMQLFYSRNTSPGPNRSNFSNSVFDGLYESALDGTLKTAGSADPVVEMQRLVSDECPWVFVHHGRENVLVGPRVRNVIPHDFPYGLEKHWRVVSGADALTP